jgi:NodT family efflux transporter outer membrane factor (OMF) lipoprotein
MTDLPLTNHDSTPRAPAREDAAVPPCQGAPTLAALAVALVSSAVLLLAGCASTGGIEATARPLAAADAGLAPGDPMPAIAPDWWQAFGDADLDRVMQRALAGSPGLRLAQSRLARAQAGVDAADAAGRVQVNGSLEATRQRFTANGLYPPPLAGSMQSTGTLQAGASWELDFFGRHQAELQSALGLQRAAQAEAQAARVLLASNVARQYVQLARLVEQRDIAARALAQRDEILGLIRQRVRAGLDTRLELRQGEGALPETRQQIEALDEQITLARHALAALSAQPPEALAGLRPRLNTLQAVPLPAALPADLLARRADIGAASARIDAATHDVAGAKAQFYPNINLTAFAGLSSIGLDRLFKAGSEQYGVGPALHLPVFDAGRLRANLRGRTADLDAAVESYNSAVIDAVHDAADQIGSLQSVARQQAEQAQAQAAAEQAYDVAVQRYKAGLATYLSVLNAEGSVLAQRRLGADLAARALDTQVALIRALGGGYGPQPGGVAAIVADPNHPIVRTDLRSPS